jgi:putative aldouronate transport system substrate-binding protein
MNSFIRKFSSVVLATIMMTAVLAGCKNNSKPEVKETVTESEKLSPVKLKWYVVGDPHKDQKMVDEEVNKKLQKDLNCTMELNFTSWNEWTTKYNLLLSSGEPIDMIFASVWADFTKFARAGAFKDLNTLLPKYAPQTWSTVPKEDWQSVTLNGKIYAVPCTAPEYTPSGLFYREDLRKKYNLPEIKDLNSLEAYMDGIKKNETTMIPFSGNPANEIGTIFFNSAKFESVQGSEQSLLQAKSYNTPRDIVAYPFTQEFNAFVKKTKSWADKGYWSKDSISSKATTIDGMKTGKGAMAWMNPSGARGNFVGFKKDHPDWEMGYFPLSDLKGYVVPNSPINNGMAIPKSASNAERSLMVLEKFRNDIDYWRLTTWGIEGYHWQLSEDKQYKISPAAGQDPKVNPGFWTTSWGWNVEKNNLKQKDDWSGWDPLNAKFKNASKTNIFAGIYLNYDNVKAENAAINDVNSKYRLPLQMGLVVDPEKGLKEYQDKLKAAGIDKFIEEVKKQANQYFDEIGVK